MTQRFIPRYMGGYPSAHHLMDLNSPFEPRPSQISLIFSCGRGGNIHDLRSGVRLLWSRYLPTEIALRLTMAGNWNYIFSRDRAERCIMLTAEGYNTDVVLIDLYTRLLQHQNRIKTRLCTYEVRMEGVQDLNRLNAVAQHYYWMSSYFERHLGDRSERHRLN